MGATDGLQLIRPYYYSKTIFAHCQDVRCHSDSAFSCKYLFIHLCNYFNQTYEMRCWNESEKDSHGKRVDSSAACRSCRASKANRRGNSQTGYLFRSNCYQTRRCPWCHAGWTLQRQPRTKRNRITRCRPAAFTLLGGFLYSASGNPVYILYELL